MIGDFIRMARERKGYSLRGVARVAGMTPNALCFIELNRVRPRHDTLLKICDVLEISELALRYAEVCEEYLDALNKMWGTDGEWISDAFDTCEIGDRYISNEEVRTLVERKVDFETFSEWYRYNEQVRYGHDMGKAGAVSVNLSAWLLGYPEELKVPVELRDVWEKEYWSDITGKSDGGDN